MQLRTALGDTWREEGDDKVGKGREGRGSRDMFVVVKYNLYMQRS